MIKLVRVLKESKVIRNTENFDKWGFGKLDILDGAYSVEAQEIPTQFNVILRDNKHPGRRLMLRLSHTLTAPDISRLFNALETEDIESVADIIKRIEYHSGYKMQKVR